jgi:hypothetical protein
VLGGPYREKEVFGRALAAKASDQVQGRSKSASQEVQSVGQVPEGRSDGSREALRVGERQSRCEMYMCVYTHGGGRGRVVGEVQVRKCRVGRV